MRRILAGLLVLAAAAAAQDLEANLKKKMAKEFVKNADWVTDFDEAKKRARTANKPIFAYFTRSYQP